MTMTKKEVMNFLTAKLAEEGLVNIIEGRDAAKKDILSSKVVYERVSDGGKIRPLTVSRTYDSTDFDVNTLNDELETRAKDLGANYVFVDTDTGYTGGKVYRIASGEAYSIIGDDEKKTLNEMQLEVPLEVYKAASEHKIGVNLNLDYKDLYVNNAKEFERYFQNLDGEVKRVSVLKELEAIPETNPDVDKWLSKNYKILIDQAYEE